MKIRRKANGKQELYISHQDWMAIGERSGWLDWDEGSGGMQKQAGVEGYRLEQMPWQITVERYGERSWAVIVNGELLAVTVYKRGAEQVKELLEMVQVSAVPAQG